MSYPPPPASPYPQSAPSGGKQRLRGRIPLRLSLVLGVIGIVLVVFGAVVLAGGPSVSGFGRVGVAQGTGSVTFSSTGSYLAYYEAGDVTSKITRVPVPIVALRSPSGATMTLDTLYGGARRETGNIGTKLTYATGGHNGVAIYQFKITEKGRYDVQVQATDGTAPGADIAFGKSIAGSLATGVALLLPGVLLLVAAGVLLLVGIFRRRGHKRELAHAYGGYPGGPPPGQYPPSGQYPPPGGGGYPPQPAR